MNAEAQLTERKKDEGSAPRALSRKRRLVLIVAALVFSTAIALTALEAWFRARAMRIVTARVAASFFLPSDPELLIRYTTAGRRLVPGAHVCIKHHRLSGLDVDMRINSLGFRDREVPARKGPNELRALVLGDSITWGDYLPAEQVYVECAERALNPLPDGRRVEIINAGVGDIGLREELCILQETGLETHPDLVVVGFYLNDSRPPWGFAGELGRPGWLRRHSVLASEVYRAYRLERWFHEHGELRYNWVSERDRSPWQDQPKSLERLAWLARYDWGAAWQEDSWPAVETELTRLSKLAKRHDFRVLVVCFPVRFQVEAQYLDDRPQRAVEARARANGFGFLDLLPLLRTHRGEAMYFDHCHPNAAANAWIGEALAQKIRAEFLGQ